MSVDMVRVIVATSITMVRVHSQTVWLKPGLATATVCVHSSVQVLQALQHPEWEQQSVSVAFSCSVCSAFCQGLVA